MEVVTRNVEVYSPAAVEQQFQWKDRVENGIKEYLPIYDVRWGYWKRPRVDVQVDGRTKDVIFVRLEDDSVSFQTGWGANMKDRDILTGEWYVLPPKASLKGLFFQFQAGQFEG